MNIYIPAIGPNEIYSQGFWYAVFAAALYLVGCIMLMVNMLGYFLGHYPQKFDLDHHQRTLILQTMMFFAWLAGGAAVFAKLEGWTYANALYWSDVVCWTPFLPLLPPPSCSPPSYEDKSLTQSFSGHQ
jgi:potassium channel subfamily K